MNCRQREGTSAALHGIERARQIPKNKMSSSHDVVQVNEIGIEFAINDTGSLHNKIVLKFGFVSNGGKCVWTITRHIKEKKNPLKLKFEV